jgi:xylulokinase
VYGPTQASGAALAWLARLLGTTPAGALAMAAEADPVPRVPPPVFLPYLGGERAPVWRTDVTAAFAGLRPEHTGADLARAVLAGVAYSDLHVLLTAGFTVAEATAVRVGGAVAANQLWARIRSAVYGVPVALAAEPESSCLGAALLAAAVGGADLRASVAALRRDNHVIAASAAEMAAAAAGFCRYQQAAEQAVEATDAV